MGDEQQTPADDASVPATVSPPTSSGTPATIIDHDTGEIVSADQSGIVFADMLDDAAIETYISDMDSVTDDSPEAIQQEIARRILNATDEAALWAATTVKNAKEVLNQPIDVTSVRWVKSAHKGGAPRFAIIDGTMAYGGQPVTVSCGGLNVVLTLYKLQKFGSLPARVQIERKASGSNEGRSVYTLVPVAR